MKPPMPKITAAWVAAQLRTNLARVLSPAVGTQVLAAMRGGEGDFARIAELLRGDPYIAAKAVALADHIGRARHMPVVSLERAVQVLGTRNVELLVLSALLVGPLLAARAGAAPTPGTPAAAHRTALWRWVLACGVAGDWLARHTAATAAADTRVADDPPPVPSGEHLAEGLILGLGVLLLEAGLEQGYAAVLGAPPRPVGLAIRERGQLGADHYQVTLWTLVAMHCPARLCPAAQALAEERDPGLVLRAAAIEVLGAQIAALDPACAGAWLVEALPRLGGDAAAGWEEALPALRAEVAALARLFQIDPGQPAALASATRREVLTAASAAIESLVVDRLTLMESLGADLRAQALEAAAVEQALEESETDPLTGVLNRRGWQRRLGELPAWRSGPLGLLMLDLDDLKGINDALGHAAGDLALRRLAEALRAVEPRPLAVGRLGGDEFAAVYPLTDAAALEATAGQIASRLAGTPVQGRALSASVGGTLSSPRELATDWQRATGRADSLLYQAKQQGRARAVVEPSAGATP